MDSYALFVCALWIFFSCTFTRFFCALDPWPFLAGNYLKVDLTLLLMKLIPLSFHQWLPLEKTLHQEVSKHQLLQSMPTMKGYNWIGLWVTQIYVRFYQGNSLGWMAFVTDGRSLPRPETCHANFTYPTLSPVVSETASGGDTSSPPSVSPTDSRW